jgi:hypothetical protein
MTEKTKNPIIVTDGALDELAKDVVILRGVIEPSCLEFLKVGSYQRELLPIVKMGDKSRAMNFGACPDIDLGMRGGNFEDKHGTFTLFDPVYIIDGQQRRAWAVELMKRGSRPHLGAIIHFNTNEQMEEERFCILNSTRIKVNANIILRNQAKYSHTLRIFVDLSIEPSFAMFNRVCWSQNQNREQLITAVTLVKVIGRLHARITPGMVQSLRNVVLALDRWTANNHHALRWNTSQFFEVVDHCWGLRLVSKKIRAPQVAFPFLMALAKVLSDHEECWKNAVMTVPEKLQNRLKTFPLFDPQVTALCLGGGNAGVLIYQYLSDHVKGKYGTQKFPPLGESGTNPGGALAGPEKVQRT